MTRTEIKKIIDGFEPQSRIVTDLAIHCTPTPEGKELSVKDIEEAHIKQGCTQIGCHFVVLLDGAIEPGRQMVLPGALVRGFNSHSIAVLYVGGLTEDGSEPKDTRTAAQKSSLAWLLEALVARIPTVNTIKGHRDYPRARTASPSFDAILTYKSLIKTNEQ